jgi:glycosyltransferase involved in cell wall biosynthesis
VTRLVHVLHTTPYFAPAYEYGGPPRSILALCKAQQLAGMTVEVFTTTGKLDGELPAAPGGTVYQGVRSRYFARSSPKALFLAPSMRHPLAAAARDVDIVHGHTLFNATAWLTANAAIRAKAPLVISTRGMLTQRALKFHEFRKRAAWLLFDRRALRYARLLHASSRDEADALRESFPGRRVVEIPNAVEFDAAAVTAGAARSVRDHMALDPSRRFILFLGRVHPIKRLDLLADAFRQVAARVDDVDLVIAGDGVAAVRAGVDDRLREVSNRVRWAGPVLGTSRDVLLAQASALVMCSDTENFGMSVAEALAAGVPVVVTRTCPWQIAADAGAGFWVEQSAEAIADALLCVLGDAVAATVMGERGRALARREYSLEAVGDRWITAYRDLIAADP